MFAEITESEAKEIPGFAAINLMSDFSPREFKDASVKLLEELKEGSICFYP